jgi:hypothetical protein
MLMLLYIISDFISGTAVGLAFWIFLSFVGKFLSSFKGINQMVLSLESEPQ